MAEGRLSEKVMENGERYASHARIVVLAAVSGFLGAMFHEVVNRRSAMIRTKAVELTGENGAVIGYWGEDNRGNVILTLKDRDGRNAIEVGVGPEDATFIHLNAPDSKSRVNLHVVEGQPTPGMSDERTEGRLLLGVVSGEVRTSENAVWGLAIRKRGSYRSKASLVVAPGKDGTASEGHLHLSGDEQRLLLAPASR